MVVTATRSPGRLEDSPVATEVITRDELESSGADTLAEVLERQPGLQLTRSFRGATIRMNGLDTDYVLILVDGQPVQGRVGGGIDLSRFPIDRIERVEIVRGAASALYGADAIGGVINIRTRRAESGTLATARVSGGAMAGADTQAVLTRFPGAIPISFRPGGEPLATVDSSAAVSIGRGRVGSWSLASIQSTPALSAPGGEGTVMNGQATGTVSERLDYKVNDDHRWTGQVAYTRRRQAGIQTSGSGAVIDSASSTEFVEASIGPDILFGEKGRITTNLAWSGFSDQAFDDQRMATALDKYEATFDRATELDIVGTVLPTEKHALTSGVELRHEVLETDRLSIARVDRQRASVFMQDVWEVIPSNNARQLLAVGGIRYDRDSLFGDAWSPRVAMRWDPAENLVLRASAGRGFRAPPFKDLYLSFVNLGVGYRVDGNPALEPERAWNESLALAWSPTEQVDFDISAQRTDLTNMIGTEIVQAGSGTGPVRYSYINVDAAWTQGVDSAISWKVLEQLLLRAHGSLLQTRDVTLDQPLQGRPPATAGAGTRVQSPSERIRLDADYFWQAPLPFFIDTNDDGRVDTVEAPAWHQIDARVEVQASACCAINLGAENLLDTGDQTYSFTRPRRLYLGLVASAATRGKGGADATN
jgi:outer membrane receptor for ferrienterochelin and colicins